MRKTKKTLWAIDGFILMASIIFSGLFLLADPGDETHAAAALLPNIVAVTCILLSLSVFIMKLQGQRAHTARAQVTGNGEDAALGSREEHTTPLLAWWWSFIAMLLYLSVILLIGFVWATLLYTLTLPFFMQYKKWKTVILTSVIVTACMYLTFSVILKINLPPGILF